MFTKNHFSGGVSNQICLCFTSHSDNLFRKMQNLYLKGIFVFRTRQFNAKSLLRIEWLASLNVILCLCCKDFFPGDIICPFWVHADVRQQTASHECVVLPKSATRLLKTPWLNLGQTSLFRHRHPTVETFHTSYCDEEDTNSQRYCWLRCVSEQCL